MLKGRKVSILVAMSEEFSGIKLRTGHFVHYTNVGKVNAAIAAKRAIDEERPDMVLNVGTAGSQKFKYGELVNCVRFVQRYMDLSSLGYAKYITPGDPVTGDLPVLEYGIELDCLPS